MDVKCCNNKIRKKKIDRHNVDLNLLVANGHKYHLDAMHLITQIDDLFILKVT